MLPFEVLDIFWHKSASGAPLDADGAINEPPKVYELVYNISQISLKSPHHVTTPVPAFCQASLPLNSTKMPAPACAKEW